MGRWEPLRRHLGFGTPSLCPDPPRSRRQVQQARLHPRLSAFARLLRPDCSRCEPSSARRPPDSPASQSRQGLCPLQLDRDILLTPGTESRVWDGTGQELRLDRRDRLERGQRDGHRRHDSSLAQATHPGRARWRERSGFQSATLFPGLSMTVANPLSEHRLFRQHLVCPPRLDSMRRRHQVVRAPRYREAAEDPPDEHIFPR